MTDMTLRIIPILMSDEVKCKMHLMLDGNSTYEEIVVYLAKKGIKTNPAALSHYNQSGKRGLYDRLMEEIEYAKRSKSRVLLYEAYGAVKMARELNAICYNEFRELNTAAVRNGINNAKIWKGVNQ